MHHEPGGFELHLVTANQIQVHVEVNVHASLTCNLDLDVQVCTREGD